MNESKISVRYSKALFQSAQGKNQLDKVYSDMLFIAELCKIDLIKEVLNSPVITPSRKRTVFHGILEKRSEGITLSLVDLLIKNGREKYLPDVARVFRDETLKSRGITQVTLTTAVSVDENTRKKVSDLVTGLFKTKVELKELVEPEIIGGYILKVNDNYIDASVRSKLRKIKKSLSGVSGTEE